jgi:prophage regulatory protein
MSQNLRIINIREVESLTSLKRSTIYCKIKNDDSFPKPVPLSDTGSGRSRMGFVLSEVLTWIEGRIAKREN